MKEKEIVRLVEFGKGGDSYEYEYTDLGHDRLKATCSGYGSPDSPHAADFGSDRKSNLQVPDGTPVIDKRAAVETGEGYAWVFRGPMCDIFLDDDQVDSCPEPSPMMAMALTSEPENQFGQLLKLQKIHETVSEEPGPLDSVSISQYVQGWRDHGARIGHYEDRKIVWDN